METLNLAFKYTQSEYVKAERKYLLSSKVISKSSIVILAAYLLFAIAYLFLSSFSLWSIVALAIAVIVGIMGSVLYFYIPIYKFRSTAKYQEEYSLLFSLEGIKFKTKMIDSELKWGVYSEVWECNDFYFLIQTPRIYTLIPKRVFTSSTEKNTFDKLVTSNMKLVQM